MSGSLICQPNFSNGRDTTRVALVALSERVICYDPEFILKVRIFGVKWTCYYTANIFYNHIGRVVFSKRRVKRKKKNV